MGQPIIDLRQAGVELRGDLRNCCSVEPITCKNRRSAAGRRSIQSAWAQLIHPMFPAGTNVEFAEVEARSRADPDLGERRDSHNVFRDWVFRVSSRSGRSWHRDRRILHLRHARRLARDGVHLTG